MSDPSLPEDDQKIRRSENDQKIIRSDDQIVTIAFGPSQSGREAKLTKSDGLAVDVQPVVIILIFYHHHQIFYNHHSHHPIESIQSGERDITNIGGHMYF